MGYLIRGSTLVLYCHEPGEHAVRVPAKIRRIEPYAFSRSRLLQIHLPQGLASIGSHAFDGCAALRSMTKPGSSSA